MQVVASAFYRSPAKASEQILTLFISGLCYEAHVLQVFFFVFEVYIRLTIVKPTD